MISGEATLRVFGNNESWIPEHDAWEARAPMTAPRHGMGAAAIGAWTYLAGGGPVQGGGFQSAYNEPFALA